MHRLHNRWCCWTGSNLLFHNYLLSLICWRCHLLWQQYLSKITTFCSHCSLTPFCVPVIFLKAISFIQRSSHVYLELLPTVICIDKAYLICTSNGPQRMYVWMYVCTCSHWSAQRCFKLHFFFPTHFSIPSVPFPRRPPSSTLNIVNPSIFPSLHLTCSASHLSPLVLLSFPLPSIFLVNLHRWLHALQFSQAALVHHPSLRSTFFPILCASFPLNTWGEKDETKFSLNALCTRKDLLV